MLRDILVILSVCIPAIATTMMSSIGYNSTTWQWWLVLLCIEFNYIIGFVRGRKS